MADRGLSRLAWFILLCLPLVVIIVIGPLAIPFFAAPAQQARARAPSEAAVGINIGTSSSRVCMVQLGKVECLSKKHDPGFASDSSSEPALRVSAIKALKSMAEQHLGASINTAVISVPNYFSDDQRLAAKEAGEAAGLTVPRTVRESVSAAIAYEFDRKRDPLNCLVYDLGGGRLDIALMNVEDGVFEMMGSASDTRVSGAAFTDRVTRYLATRFNERYNAQVDEDPKAMEMLRQKAERAKKVLSSRASVEIGIKSLHKGNDFLETLSRAQFEDLNSDLFEKTSELLNQVLQEARLVQAEVYEILLVGGSTRIPKIQSLTRDYFPYAVFSGNGAAAFQSINPDEAVARVAAKQCAVLMSDEGVSHCPIGDVNPLTLGIETGFELMTPVIRRNTVIPTRKSANFSTSRDYQSSVAIRIYEGERPLTTYNRLVHVLELEDIPAAPMGEVQIEVTFELDPYGDLKVSATEKRGGKSASIVIPDKQSLSPTEIDRRVHAMETAFHDDYLAVLDVLEMYTKHLRHRFSAAERPGIEVTDSVKNSLLEIVIEFENALSHSMPEDGYSDLITKQRSMFNKLYEVSGGLTGYPGQGSLRSMPDACPEIAERVIEHEEL